MSYTDKCCGVCNEYQDIYETGKLEVSKTLGWVSPEYKRFYDTKTNVCVKCIKDKALDGVNVKDLRLHVWYNEPENITKGSTMFVNPDTGKWWSCPNNRLLKDEQNLCDKKLKYSKANPYLYFITGVNLIKHERLFGKHSGINSSDKRRLRRTLRKLGVKGRLKMLIE
ncbi:hypothetical protein HWD03_gp086 [Alteromonas phage vB_AmeM_PT11-V22]|uniref:Uncharacterized protein n=1 Tax=Alteromonas phage vB_AmeM_PT11-V22 TaxID=2704031 RepID=A0A6C0R1V9_9CAUD|nr:hypothetical protein HWD03_gp086 [Alteromonas phage vB_AmeM_PT11-V22]QHZ59767.1 hypothetical protein [Alteromonas phage vB_AmeM_PT11-V22]